MWNPRRENRRDASFLEDMIRAFDLQVLNDNRATRPSDGIHSIADLALASPGAGADCRGWVLVDRREQASASGHEMIEWEWGRGAERVNPGWGIRGWALKERLDKGHPQGREGVLGDLPQPSRRRRHLGDPRYTKPQRSAAVTTISHRAAVAEDNKSKSRMLTEISFPPPVPYKGDEGQEGPQAPHTRWWT